MRSIEYTYASIEDVEKYYNKTKHHVYYLAKMHPALVEFDELDKVSQELSRVCQKHIELKDDVQVMGYGNKEDFSEEYLGEYTKRIYDMFIVLINM